MLLLLDAFNKLWKQKKIISIDITLFAFANQANARNLLLEPFGDANFAEEFWVLLPNALEQPFYTVDQV